MVKLTGLFSLSGILGKALSIPHAIIIASVLGPTLLGLYAFFNLILSYSSYTQLGQIQSLAREVPIEYGRGNNDQVKVIRNTIFTSFSYTVILTILGVWLIYIYGFTAGGLLNDFRMLILTSLLVIDRANNFLRVYIKGDGVFSIIAKFDFYEKILPTLLGIPLVVIFELDGLIFSKFLISVITFLYYYSSLGFPSFSYRLDLPYTFELMKTGFLVYINKIASGLFWNIDLTIIALLLSSQDAGQYTFALSFFLASGFFFRGINMHMFRKIMLQGNEMKNKFVFLTKTNLILYLLLINLVVGLSSLAQITLINVFLTEFDESIDLIIILTMGYMIYISRIWFTYYMNVTNQLKRQIAFISTAFFINIVLDYHFISEGFGIKGVALACSISFVILSYSIIGSSLFQITGASEGSGIMIKFFLTSIIATYLIYESQSFYFSVFDSELYYLHMLNIGFELFLKISIYSTLICLVYLVIFPSYNLLNEAIAIIHIIRNIISEFLIKRFSKSGDKVQ